MIRSQATGSVGEVSDNELGAVIRGRREAIKPADVGLPAGPRRRTPGLRRTELAMLVGIRVEYLTRIEQGRDRNPSPQILGGEDPNLVRYLFADPRAKEAFPDWDRVADEHLAVLRSAFSPTDRHLQGIADYLAVLAGDQFTRRIRTFPGPERRAGAERVVHPDVGELRLLYETLHLDGHRIIVYIPANDTARAALDLLIGVRPGALRSVTA
jgi:transcriptional regulator with XRE-family HTH domain